MKISNFEYSKLVFEKHYTARFNIILGNFKIRFFVNKICFRTKISGYSEMIKKV